MSLELCLATTSVFLNINYIAKLFWMTLTGVIHLFFNFYFLKKDQFGEGSPYFEFSYER